MKSKLLIFASLFLFLTQAICAQGPITAPPSTAPKPVATITPVLVIDLAFRETTAEKLTSPRDFQVHLTVRNAVNIPPALFAIPAGKLPPNPCAHSVRFVGSVTSAKGKLLASCLPFPTRESLVKFSIFVKDSEFPGSIYFTLRDQFTGKISRSKTVQIFHPQYSGSGKAESGAP